MSKRVLALLGCSLGATLVGLHGLDIVLLGVAWTVQCKEELNRGFGEF